MNPSLARIFSGVRMQLVTSVFVAIAPVLVLTYIVNQSWFWQFAPDWLRNYFLDVPWVSLTIGLLALAAAWFGGERFILRQVRALSDAANRLGKGDMGSRTGLRKSPGELGQLAAVFDEMAESLQQRVKDLQRADAEVRKLAAFAQMNPNPALKFTADGSLIYFNEAALKLARSVGEGHPRDILPADLQKIVHDCLQTGRSKLQMETKSGDRTFSWSFHPMLSSQVVHCYIEDITDRLNLEAQLRQAQKMESVGQLAAGVAHDFNNMLTIIQGHTSSLLARQTLPEDISDPIQAVYFAAERAARLTRQLLMFSRKNVMQMGPLDLRECVSHLTKMLCLLIGENIVLEFQPPAALPLVVGDNGMIEQVLMNLSVNARDAMPQGGHLTIALEAVRVDERYVETHPEAHVGDFVRLRVRDTGVGMSATTLAHIFEPFFTTKQIGKGTGLGLATVYGIVKQHDGWMEVVSELNQGTSFDLFFPADITLTIAARQQDALVTSVTGGAETVFIVEDEPLLREMVSTILRGCGYHIIEANSGIDALKVWDQHAGRVDLLLTDMVMPEGMTGVDLAERLLLKKPDLKVVFTSGYTTSEISAEVLARTHAHFLQKPFTHATVAQTVRDCLDKSETTRNRILAG
jgi:signal transduction histidine kinase/CheY-like chemotaxis protein